MKQTITGSLTDPMGAAIYDYHATGKADRLRVLSSMFEEDEIPVETLFRSFDEMPFIEQEALKLAKGQVLDVGAGSGCHSLVLQDMGKQVTALDISPLAVKAMRERGVRNVVEEDFFCKSFSGTYDTILMLMNGSGIIGELANMPLFFKRARQLLAPGGSILMDSCDLSYVFEDEDGFFDTTEFDNYYGEVDFQMCYKDITGNTFNWLYIDFDTLQEEATRCGFKAEMVAEGENNAYLARLVVN